MRRAIQLTLLAIFVSSTIVGIVIGFVATHTITQEAIDRELEVAHQGIAERFKMFDALLRKEEEAMERQMEKALPILAERLLSDISDIGKVTDIELQDLSRELGVDNVYVIDANTKIIATDFGPDKGFELGTISDGFRKFLVGMIGSGKIIPDRINMSSKTGILTKYAYYSPVGSQHIAEVSVSVRDFLSRERSPEFVDFLFRSFFQDFARTRENLVGIDIHMVNRVGVFSLFDRNSDLSRSIADTLYDQDRLVDETDDGVVVYSKLSPVDTRLNTADFLAITTKFDFSDLKQRVIREISFLVVMMIAASALTYALAVRLAVKYVVDRVEAVRGGVAKISNGEYGDRLEVPGSDEINDIVTDINVMRLRIRDDIEAREKLANEMTDLAAQQAQLRIQAEAAERTKSEFLSVVSHELRTPLTSIGGSLSILNANVSDEFSEKTRNLITMAKRNSERLNLLINDLLDLEKIQSGQMVFEMESVDIGKMVEHTIESNQGYVDRLGVKLETAGNKPPAVVRGDENRLLQVMSNLISNAAKYSEAEGIVTVTWTRHRFPLDKEWIQGVRIAVADTGTGIPEEFQPRVFQPFSQADSSITRSVGGTGLGLSISKVIVEHHGGLLSFESEMGKGTVFYVDLPVVSG